MKKECLRGDQYRYVIRIGKVAREFNDPRAQQLTGFDPPNGFGLPGSDDKPKSVIVDPNFNMPAFSEPTFNTLVIYEMHIGTFANTFTGAAQKLDYLKNLGINAVEVLPITQNLLFSDHTPADHDWGYDPVQLFAIKSKHGTPQDFKGFIKQCHQRQIAVIVDVVYNHLAGKNLLNKFGDFATPQIPAGIFFYGGDRANTGFGPARITAGPKSGSTSSKTHYCCSATTVLMDYGSTTQLTSARLGNHAPPIRRERNFLQEINSSYRDTDPKQPGKITIAEDLQSSGDVTLQSGPTGLEFISQWDDTMVNTMRGVVTHVNDSDRDIFAVSPAARNSPSTSL